MTATMDFGSRIYQNKAQVETYEEDGKKQKRTLPPAESCPRCGDDAVLALRAVFTVGGVTSSAAVPCKWCVLGLALAANLERGRPGVRPIRVDMTYTEADVWLDEQVAEQAGDVELANRWLEAGWERRADGFMYRLRTGERAPLLPPEECLPPRPDGSRPDRPRGAQFLSPVVASVDDPDRRRPAEPRRRHGVAYPVRFVPAEGGCHAYVDGVLGCVYDAPIIFADLGKRSSSRAELEAVARHARQGEGRLLAALRRMAREKAPREHVVRPEPRQPE